MQTIPFVWPSGSRGIFVGNIRATEHANALETFGIKRVLVIDDSLDHGATAAVCRAAKVEYYQLLVVGDALHRNERRRFADVIVPWVRNAWEFNSPVLIASPLGHNHALAVAIACIATFIEAPDFEMAVGLAVEMVLNSCTFAKPDAELVQSFLEAVGFPLPEACKKVLTLSEG